MKITKSKRSFDIQFKKNDFHPHLWIENCIDQIRNGYDTFRIGIDFIFDKKVKCRYIALWFICFKIEFDF